MKEFSYVDISLDFSAESENIALDGSQEEEGVACPKRLKAQAVVKPMTSQIVAVVRAYDNEWSTACRVTLRKRTPSWDEQRQELEEKSARLKSRLRRPRRIGKGSWG